MTSAISYNERVGLKGVLPTTIPRITYGKVGVSMRGSKSQVRELREARRTGLRLVAGRTNALRETQRLEDEPTTDLSQQSSTPPLHTPVIREDGRGLFPSTLAWCTFFGAGRPNRPCCRKDSRFQRSCVCISRIGQVGRRTTNRCMHRLSEV
jgi:hypothetical protein